MKAILEFNLPEEREEFENAQNGGRYFSCLDQIRQLLREQRKYKDQTGRKPQEVIEEIEKEFFDITEGLLD